MAGLLRRVQRDEGGVATIEFGIWVTAFFLVIMGVLDFASFYMERSRVNEALSAAATKSFADRENVDFGALPGYVRNFAEMPALGVTASCNGVAAACTNLNRTCACLKNDGTYRAGTCGDTCTGAGMTSGSTAGYYVTLSANHRFSPILLPGGLLKGMSSGQSVTVRVQ
ncbi:TadE/TadG family type IV pilus assembly protein [Novosphingobium sp. KN65.2]|uniref:TadE/TadG family type IV pilus assembly protein n=1 Tax=Novosphingobium sp. KN65.2 TaxID=1478134 RepID=UPI0005E5F4C9|nr:TadE family protein [Novosphingobium sp. KN65.2]CDO36045.1 conserved hypothetical protein [Novosphingobium sp. KN65.2]